MEKVLSINAEKTLKNNIKILYNDFSNEVKYFVDAQECMGDLQYINAYLSATLNAIIAYVDRLIDVGRMKETEMVQALKFANNLQKHNPNFISISKQIGGLEFPMHFPMVIPMYDVVWDECIGLKTKKPEQKTNYDELLKQRSIFESITYVVEILLKDDFFKEL